MIWNIEETTGYKPKTTFWQDFSIADAFGKSAIQDTYNRAFKEWKSNVEFITELTMVLNWKLWFYYENGNHELARLYQSLFEKTDAYCMDNLKGKDLDYFIRTTD